MCLTLKNKRRRVQIVSAAKKTKRSLRDSSLRVDRARAHVKNSKKALALARAALSHEEMSSIRADWLDFRSIQKLIDRLERNLTFAAAAYASLIAPELRTHHEESLVKPHKSLSKLSLVGFDVTRGFLPPYNGTDTRRERIRKALANLLRRDISKKHYEAYPGRRVWR